MRIKIKDTARFADVQVLHDRTTIDLGLLNLEDIRRLIIGLETALSELKDFLPEEIGG